MKELTKEQTKALLATVRREATCTQEPKAYPLACPNCHHKAFMAYEGTRGHIQSKCRKCNQISTYDVMFRRNGNVMFRLVKEPCN